MVHFYELCAFLGTGFVCYARACGISRPDAIFSRHLLTSSSHFVHFRMIFAPFITPSSVLVTSRRRHAVSYRRLLAALDTLSTLSRLVSLHTIHLFAQPLCAITTFSSPFLFETFVYYSLFPPSLRTVCPRRLSALAVSPRHLSAPALHAVPSHAISPRHLFTP